MKLFFYELLKLLKSRAIICVLACLTLLNAAVCLHNGISHTSHLPSDTLEQIYTLYYNDPEYVDMMYSDWMELYEAYEDKHISYIKRGGEEPIPPANVWLDYDQNDYTLYKKLYYDAERPLVYRDSLTSIINSAQSTILSMESDLNTENFTYRYQTKIVDIYTRLYNTVRIGYEHTSGYDVYFSSRAPLYISLIACVFIAGYWYTIERGTAAYSLIRTTSRGRYKIACAKVAAAFSVGIGFFLTAQLVWFFTVGKTVGFGSIYNAIQAYSHFTFCQYDLTVLEYLFADTALKILCISVFISICLLIASVTDHLTSSVISSTALLLCFAHHYLTVNIPDNLIHLNNIISLSCTSMERYHAVNLFGNPYDSLFAIAIVYVAILLILTIVSVVLYVGTTEPKFKIKFPGTFKLSKYTFVPRFRFRPAASLLNFESRKLFGSRAAIILIILYFVYIGAACTVDIYDISTDDEKLRDYIMTSLYGEAEDEKYKFVANEGKRLDNAVKTYESTVGAYYRGEVSIDVFKPIADERAYADSRNVAYTKLREYTQYITSIDSTPTPWFVYDGGWNRLFSQPIDPFLVIICCYIGALISGVEYSKNTSSGSFYAILSTTKNGRVHTFRRKLLLAVLISTILYSVRYTVSIISLDNIYTLRGFTAPLYSLPQLSGHMLESASILTYTVLHFVYGLIFISLISAFAMSLTIILKRSFASFGIAAALCLLPVLFEYIGVAIFDGISIYRLSNLTNIPDLSQLTASGICVVLLTAASLYAHLKFTNPDIEFINRKAR